MEALEAGFGGSKIIVIFGHVFEAFPDATESFGRVASSSAQVGTSTHLGFWRGLEASYVWRMLMMLALGGLQGA